jgi:hypothetical protein
LSPTDTSLSFKRGDDMVIHRNEIFLSDGTLVRHRISGYLGRIQGVTAIQGCFTDSGAPMPLNTTKDEFQYRVIVRGEKMRRIAPPRDLEVLDATTSVEVTCFSCQNTFSGIPSVNDKPGGLCECGGWICPECLLCQASKGMRAQDSAQDCANQRKRLVKRTMGQKQKKSAPSKLRLVEV